MEDKRLFVQTAFGSVSEKTAEKTNPKQPDFTGTVEFKAPIEVGQKYYVSMWRKTNEYGHYIGISIGDKVDPNKVKKGTNFKKPAPAVTTAPSTNSDLPL